jgi:hypothetical protein
MARDKGPWPLGETKCNWFRQRQALAATFLGGL